MTGTPVYRRCFVLAAACMCALLVLMMFPSLGNFALGNPTTNNNNQSEDCKAHFYAYDSSPGSNQFGPKQTTLIDLMKTDLTRANELADKRLDEKLSCDPLYAATFVSFVKSGYQLDVNQVHASANTYQKDRQVWKNDVKAAMDKVTATTLSTESESYDTLAMKLASSSTQTPSVFKVNENHAIGEVLVLRLEDGTTRQLRIICDMQPVAPRFPNVPKTPKPTPKPVPSKTPVPTCPGTNNPVPPNGVCPKDATKDPQSQGNVPIPVTKNSPSVDNDEEIANGPVAPTDSGNGIPSGGTPRATPSPAPTHTGPTAVPAPTSSPASEPAVEASPTASGGVPTHKPGGG